MGITSRPDASSDGIDGLPSFQWMLSKQPFDRLAIDVSIDQRVIDAAPAPLKTGSQAQMRGRKYRASGEQCIDKVDERVTTPCEKLVHLLTEVGQ